MPPSRRSSSARAVFEPTNAFTRAAGISLVVLLVAALLRRPDLVILVVPLLVHAAWGWWRRPGADVPAPTAATTPERVSMAEGEGVDLGIAVTPHTRGHLIGVQWPGMVDSAWDPTYGAVLDSPAPDDEGSGLVTVGLEPLRWGRHTTERPGVQVTDESGSWRAALPTEPAHVLVRPAAATLEGASGVARPIGLTGAHTSSVRGDGTQLADIREYRPGDRLRRINWRVTSRTQRLHVTSTFTERDTDVLVVVDTLRDLTDPRGQSSSLDATVRAVAAIAQHYVGFGDRVALHDLGRRVGHVRSGTGPRQIRIMIDVLSRALRDVPDHVALRSVMRVRSGTIVFFCSPLLDDRIVDQLVRVRQLGGEVIVVDTLPAGLGDPAGLGALRGLRDARNFLGEAWVLRRMQREVVVEGIERLGIPVVPWRGTASLGSVLLAMEHARSAPRLAGGRGAAQAGAGRGAGGR
ncbi:DUF58 domain-containing protein [Aestuariimicrobium soli]|uniref:DUF58 domain-containing protein n=1 Tax=Aestuariimicrobium soli TaxID=2035834 RepID=UPI003EBC2DEA